VVVKAKRREVEILNLVAGKGALVQRFLKVMRMAEKLFFIIVRKRCNIRVCLAGLGRDERGGVGGGRGRDSRYEVNVDRYESCDRLAD
jgi:hypothetical protein